MTTATQPERRLHERFTLAPMYTDVTVQCVENLSIDRFEGHAYDISESGVRIELDVALEIGQGVALHLSLPGQDTPMFVAADVVWVNDELDDPGPRRMALHHGARESLGVDQERVGSRLQPLQYERARLLAYLGNAISKRAA